jgi:hypothetical protein
MYNAISSPSYNGKMAKFEISFSFFTSPRRRWCDRNNFKWSNVRPRFFCLSDFAMEKRDHLSTAAPSAGANF